MAQALDNFLTGRLMGKSSIAELYHENTKIYRGSEPYLSLRGDDPVISANRQATEAEFLEKEYFVAAHGKEYPTADKVRLPAPSVLKGTTLRESFRKRQSCTDFCADETMKTVELSTLLHYTYGINASSGGRSPSTRYVPSAGALYPLELYVISTNIQGLSPGSLFHYQPEGHYLEFMGACPTRRTTGELLAQGELIDAASVIFISARPPRLTWKYGDRGYRYALLEAGHAAQNACLVASALKLKACPVAGYFDDRVHDLFMLDGVSEIVVYTLCVGR